ncbi:MAG: hypothetical protein AAF702_44420 [Chloroflexota bacterium]
MESKSELANKLLPYLLTNTSSSAGTAAATGGLSPHALDGAFHTGELSDNQAPQFLLTSGARPMTGPLNLGSNNITNVGLINGVDITDLAASAAGQIVAGDGISITGGGLIANTPTISLDHAQLITAVAGPGLQQYGLGQIGVNVGDGLSINGGTNALQLSGAIGGPGLDYSSGVLSVQHGSGLTTSVTPGVLTVDYATLAGNGLGTSGSGLFVNPGANIQISGDAVAVDVPSLAGDGLSASGTALTVNTGDALEIVSGNVQVRAPDLVGDGLGSVGNNLEVRAGNGLALSSGSVVVDEAHNFAWTGLHTHAANISSPGAVTGQTGWTITPAGDADFRDIQADTLIVDAFVADTNLALAGSEYITISGATVAEDFVSPATTGTLTVYDNLADTQSFRSGDTVALRYIDRGTGLDVGFVYGTVTSYVDLPEGKQSWTFTRTSGVSGKRTPAGVWAIGFGVPGDGVIKSTVNDVTSPYIDMATWTGTAHNPANFTTHLRLGNLAGISDPDLNPTGYGIYADAAYLRAEIALGAGEVILDGGGLSLNSLFQFEDTPNTPEKVTWYRDNNNRTAENATAALWSNHQTSPTPLNTASLASYAGYRGGNSTGSDLSQVHISAQWRPQTGAPDTADFATFELLGQDNDSRANLIAQRIQIGYGSISPAGSQIEMGGSVVRPLVDLGTDLGEIDRRFNRIYVDEIVAGTTSTTDSGHNHDDRYYLKATIDGNLAVKSNTGHTHAGYALQSYVDTELAGKSEDTHGHASLASIAYVDGQVSGLAADTHAHGDLYYTEAEVNALLATKENTGHTHNFSTVTDHADLLNIGANDHHNQIHAIDGPDHTGNLPWSRVDKTGALLGDLGGTLAWTIVDKTGALLSDLGGTLAWTNVDKTGSDLADIGGTLAWANLNKTGSSLADLASRSHADLTDIGANDHHAQVHALNGSDHTGVLADSQFPNAYLIDGTRSITGNVLNDGGFDQDIGSLSAPWRNLHVLELMATRLVPQDVMATLDGRIMVSTSGKLTRDLADGATTIYLDTGIFTNGEYGYLQAVRSGVPRFEAVQFASDATTITAGVEYSYTVVRNLDEPGDGSVVSAFRQAGVNNMLFADAGFNTSLFTPADDLWLTGDGLVSLGKEVGDGYIDIASQTSIAGGEGPTISISSRGSTSAWNDINQVVAMGNLQNRLDYADPTFGFAVGSNLNSSIEQFTGLTATSGGVRLLNTPLTYYYSASGVQTAGAFFGADADTPNLKIGPDTSQLFGDAPGGFSGHGLWSGFGPSGFATYIGNSDTSYLEVAGDIIRTHGTLSTGGADFTNNLVSVYGTSQVSFSESTSEYGISISQLYDNNPAVDTRYLYLRSDYVTGQSTTKKSAIRLESFTNGVSDARMTLDDNGVLLNGRMRIIRDETIAADGLFISSNFDSNPAINLGDNLEMWGNDNRVALVLQSTDAGAGGSGFSASSGPHIEIGHNSNTAQPAAGYMKLTNQEGRSFYLWVDKNDKLRFGASVPTNPNDESGSEVQLV